MQHACPICRSATTTSICASCAQRHEGRCSPAPDADEAEVIRWAAAHGISTTLMIEAGSMP